MRIHFSDPRVPLALDRLVALEQQRADEAGLSVVLSAETLLTAMVRRALQRHQLGLDDFTPPEPERLVPTRPRGAWAAEPEQTEGKLPELVETLKTLVRMLQEHHNLSQAAIVRECGFKASNASRLSLCLGGNATPRAVAGWIENCRALLKKKAAEPEVTLPGVQKEPSRIAPKSAPPAPARATATDEGDDDDGDDDEEGLDPDDLLDGDDDDGASDDVEEDGDDDDGLAP